jgi:uncharacterized protein (DUF2345 family)
MCFDAAGTVHRFLQGAAISLINAAVRAMEYLGALALDRGTETVDVARDFNLFAQRQALNTPDDSFDDTHCGANEAAIVAECEQDFIGKTPAP